MPKQAHEILVERCGLDCPFFRVDLLDYGRMHCLALSSERRHRALDRRFPRWCPLKKNGAITMKVKR